MLLAITLASCSTATELPTRVNPIVGQFNEIAPSPPTGGSDNSPVRATETIAGSISPGEPTAVVQTPQPDNVAAATQTPLSDGGGIRPGEALLLREPELGLESPVDWRPPPVAVPHSIHPDDHYWLARPIASDSRNYDLSWYHYANRPMRVEALPYRVHHGLDFPNETGTPIFAASSGTVVWAGNLPSSRDGVNYYGNTVIIKHDWLWLGENVYTLYAHTLELFVEVDDVVEKGQLIAGVGASGEVSGPHLHLEVRVGKNNYQSTRNPALWMAPYEGWGTLAGRFMDQRGRLIHGAQISVFPVEIDNNVEVSIKRLRTYEPSSINSDDVWLENFVVGDLPAGEYRVVISTAGETFRRTVFIRPGQTNYIVLQADFDWGPTATPAPTITPVPSLTATRAGTPAPAE
jgi:murein DD-endopeptidase MepM/ murein hydrolase activator NlpD